MKIVEPFNLQPRNLSQRFAISFVLFAMVCLGAFSLPVFAQGEVREIRIRAAVSSSFKADPDWQEDIRSRVSFANRIFEPAFKIHFSVKDYADWEPQDEAREMDLLIEELRGLILPRADEIVIGFHKMKKAYSRDKVLDIETVGTAQALRGFVVIRDPYWILDMLHKEVILTHELGHLFGTVHVSDENAIMHASVPVTPSLILDDDNAEIIGWTRAIDFERGLDSLTPAAIEGLVRVYEKLIRLNPQSDFYHQLGLFYRKLKLEARAVSVWEEATHYHYDNPYIQRELGLTYYRSGRYEQTIQALGSSVAHFFLPSQKKQRAETLNALGVAYFEKGITDLAIFQWLQGLVSDPDNTIIQSNLAAAYLQSGDIERGVAELEKLAAKNPSDATILSNLGAAYSRHKEPAKALEFLGKALEKLSAAPLSAKSEEDGDRNLFGGVSESQVRLNMGTTYLELKQTQNAIYQLEKAKALAPDNFDVHRNLARAYLETKAYENAIKEIHAALRYKNNDPYLYAFLGQSYAETGRPDEAMQALNDGLRYGEGELAAGLHKNKAVLYAQKRDFPSAVAEIKTALNLQWKDPEAHTNLGLIYANMGRMEDAERSLQNALRLDSKFEPAKRALESFKNNRAQARKS